MFNKKYSILPCISAIFLSFLPCISAISQVDVKLEDCKKFIPYCSLAPEEMYYSLKYATYEDTLQVLEFGSIERTVRFCEILRFYGIPYQNNTFIDDVFRYSYNIPNVTVHYYSLTPFYSDIVYEWKPETESVDMSHLPIADLVLIYGPCGISRSEWINEFKHLTRNGTIILISDFHNHKEFSEELDKNFIYETMIESTERDKFFKIVRVVETK